MNGFRFAFFLTRPGTRVRRLAVTWSLTATLLTAQAVVPPELQPHALGRAWTEAEIAAALQRRQPRQDLLAKVVAAEGATLFGKSVARLAAAGASVSFQEQLRKLAVAWPEPWSQEYVEARIREHAAARSVSPVRDTPELRARAATDPMAAYQLGRLLRDRALQLEAAGDAQAATAHTAAWTQLLAARALVQKSEPRPNPAPPLGWLEHSTVPIDLIPEAERTNWSLGRMAGNHTRFGDGRASSADPEGALLLGEVYFGGTIGQRPHLAAAEHFLLAAAARLPAASEPGRRARERLAGIYAGDTPTASHPQLAAWWHDLARRPDPAGAIGRAHAQGQPAPAAPPAAAEVTKLERQAAAGDATARVALAELYLEGRGVWRDDGRAQGLLLDAAEQGHQPAMRRLAELFDGRVFQTSVVERVWEERESSGAAEPRLFGGGRWWKRVADGGAGDAMMRLADAYLSRNYDWGIEKPDEARGLDWMQRAVEAGHGPAIGRLSVMTADGSHGLTRDAAEAERLAFLAAAKGEYWAIDRLVRGGVGTDEATRTATAIRLYRALLDRGDQHYADKLPELEAKAHDLPPPGPPAQGHARVYDVSLRLLRAEAGEVSAMIDVAWAARQALGQPQDLAAAERWVKAAEASGLAAPVLPSPDANIDDQIAHWRRLLPTESLAARFELARLLRIFKERLRAGEKPAVAQLEALAAEGVAGACVELAILYSWGAEADPGKERAWAEKAADLGSSQGMTWLARLLEPSDPAGARARAAQAAELGSLEGAYLLGTYWLLGTGGARDYAEARAHLQRADEGGHARASVTLGGMAELGLGLTQPDANEAARWFRRAAVRGSPQAAHRAAKHGTDDTAPARQVVAAARRTAEAMAKAASSEEEKRRQITADKTAGSLEASDPLRALIHRHDSAAATNEAWKYALAEAHAMKAILALRARDQAGAKTAAEAAVNLDAAQPEANLLLARIEAQAGNMKAATERLNDLLWYCPTLADAYALRAQIFQSQQDVVRMETDLRAAVALAPSNGQIRGALLQYYASVWNWDEAGTLAREAKALGDPKADDVLRQLNQLSGGVVPLP